MTDLVDLFVGLPRPSSAGAYSVDTERSNCRIAKTFDGHPAVLISLKTDNGAKVPRRLANLVYVPPGAVEIRTAAGTQSAKLAIIECCTRERRLTSYFFRIVAEALMPEAANGDESRFEAALDAVITLFRALTRPGSKTIQGLWSEASAIVAYSADAQVALSSWHSSPRALHDFSNGPVRLEVKSTTKKLREHTFLLDQLTAGTAGQILVASFLLDESDGGCSVFDLVAVIRKRITNPQSLNRLETIVADSLGMSFEEVDEHRYAIDAARMSLLLYRSHDLPMPLLPLPPEIKEVSFTLDMSTSTPIALAEARVLAPFFRDLLPTE